MSTCQDRIRETLPEFAHGLLDPSEMARVADHLEICTVCASEVRVLRQLENESIPAPPPWFFSSLPGKVTAQVDARRKRKVRILIPVWAGGFATAAIAVFMLLQPGTVLQFQPDENGYMTSESAGAAYVGLEEELLAVSEVVIDDLEKPLVRDLEVVSEEYISATDLILVGDGYETMDGETIQIFEGILEKMTPKGVRKKVLS